MKKSCSQNGFTLLEVLVASFIFLSAMAAFSPAFIATVRRHNVTAFKTGAFQVAQQQLDTLRQQDISALPASGTVGPTSVLQGGRSYDVYTKYCGTPAYCVNPSTRGIGVQVFLRGQKLYEVETVFTQLR